MMRPVRHEDVHAAARVLAGVAKPWRSWVLQRMFREATAACKCGAVGHAIWGDGSLMTAALRRRPKPAPALSDIEYCKCLSQIYLTLARRGCHPEAQDTQLGIVGSSLRRPSGISSPQS